VLFIREGCFSYQTSRLKNETPLKGDMMSKLQGKIAVITGGNSGIGLATAAQFVAEGAHVFITGRRQKELDAAVALIGRNVTAVQGDVSKLTDLDRLYAQVAKEKGRVDILFANAGIGIAAANRADNRTRFRSGLQRQSTWSGIHRSEGVAPNARRR
jgi:NAD(P)-dependent dehydrogenase (short-subunit alcohol dehydrogenase family)